MLDHLELVYYFIAFIPGVTLNIFLIIMYLKFRNAYIGFFAMAYLGTSLLVLCYLINDFLSCLALDHYFRYTAYVEVFCMAIVIWSVSILILKMFFGGITAAHKILFLVLSIVPVIIYSLWFFGVWATQSIDDIYYLYFIAVLVFDCILFLLKFRQINQNVFQRLGVITVCVLSFFLIFFIIREFVPAFTFDTFPLFYLLLTIQLISFGWKHFLKDNIDKVLNMKKRFAEKYKITNREQEIIQLIQAGHTNSSIGKQLFISEKTVANHIYNIYKKLNITSRFELICLLKG